MHRHSRIHKKDDPTQLGVKPGPRKSKAKMFTKPEIHPALLPTGVHMDKFLHGAGLESQFGLGVMKPVSTILPDLTFSRLPMVPSVSMMHGMYKGDHSQVFVKREPEVPVAVSVCMKLMWNSCFESFCQLFHQSISNLISVHQSIHHSAAHQLIHLSIHQVRFGLCLFFLYLL